MNDPIAELEAQKRHYEKELEKNQAQWSALRGRKLFAAYLAIVGAVGCVGYLIAPFVPPVEGAEGLPFLVCIALLIGGAIWWWTLKRQTDQLLDRSMALHDTLCSIEERYYEP